MIQSHGSFSLFAAARPQFRAVFAARKARQSGAERVLALAGAGVEALVLAGEVIAPVLPEVAVIRT